MVLLIVVSVPIVFLNELNSIAALVLVRGADFLSVFEKRQREALALLFLKLHSQGFVVAEMFWGLWLFPLAVLVYRSRFLPRFLVSGLSLPESLGNPERGWHSVAAISGQGLRLCSACIFWRDSAHAVALD